MHAHWRRAPINPCLACARVGGLHNTKAVRRCGCGATPLGDLNVVHAEIPAVLVEAQKEPYSVPSDLSCASLRARVRALEEVLGPDLDAPASASNPGLIERGSSAAGTAAVGALRHTGRRCRSFRGWVRKLSGAERYSKQVAAAIAAGTVRRAFLKGLGVQKECP